MSWQQLRRRSLCAWPVPHTVPARRSWPVTGSAGKVANCQIGVSLSVATRTEHLPVDFELYLPECWANDEAHRREARIPSEVSFRTKPQLALQISWRTPQMAAPATLREHRRSLGFHYALAVAPQTTVFLLDAKGRPRKDARSVSDLAQRIQERGGFRRCTWRQGTQEALSACFALRRVVAAGVPQREQEPLGLLIEWRDGEREPANSFITARLAMARVFVTARTWVAPHVACPVSPFTPRAPDAVVSRARIAARWMMREPRPNRRLTLRVANWARD
nr:transposase [Myxococcus xanthus]